MTNRLFVVQRNNIPKACLVSEIDFEWLCQWSWRWTRDKRGKKFYAVRNSSKTVRGVRKQFDVYMHKAILERMGAIPPSSLHVIGEHGNGDSMDNTRENLSWITRSQNNVTARNKTPRDEASGRFVNRANPKTVDIGQSVELVDTF